MSAFQSHPHFEALMAPPTLFPQKRPRSPGPAVGTPRGSQHPRVASPPTHPLASRGDNTWGPPARCLQAGEQQQYSLASLETQASSDAVFLELVSSPSSPWASQPQGCTANPPLLPSAAMHVPKRPNSPALSVATQRPLVAHQWHASGAPAAHQWHKAALAPALEVGSPSPSSLSSSASCHSSCPSGQSSPALHRLASGSSAGTPHFPGSTTNTTNSASHFAGHHANSWTPAPQHTIPISGFTPQRTVATGAITPQHSLPSSGFTPAPSSSALVEGAPRAPLLLCATSCTSSDLDLDPPASSSSSSFSLSFSFSPSPSGPSHGVSSAGAPLALHRLHSAGLSGPLEAHQRRTTSESPFGAYTHERLAGSGPSGPMYGDEGLGAVGGKGGLERDAGEGSSCLGSVASMEEDDAASPLPRQPYSHPHTRAQAPSQTQSQTQAQSESGSQWQEHQLSRLTQLSQLNSLLPMSCSSGGFGSWEAPAPFHDEHSPNNHWARRPTLLPNAPSGPPAAPSEPDSTHNVPCSMGAWKVGPWSLANTSHVGLTAVRGGSDNLPKAQGTRVPSAATAAAPGCAERRPAAHAPSAPLTGLLSRALRGERGEPLVHREGDGGYSILVNLNPEPGVGQEELTRSRREILGTRHGTPSRRWL